MTGYLFMFVIFCILICGGVLMWAFIEDEKDMEDTKKLKKKLEEELKNRIHGLCREGKLEEADRLILACSKERQEKLRGITGIYKLLFHMERWSFRQPSEDKKDMALFMEGGYVIDDEYEGIEYENHCECGECAHCQRDLVWSEQFGLPVKEVSFSCACGTCPWCKYTHQAMLEEYEAEQAMRAYYSYQGDDDIPF